MRDTIANAIIRGAKTNTEARESVAAITELIDAAQEVRASWERGDLAGAVTRLSAALDEIDS
jgi:hypothetical protein